MTAATLTAFLAFGYASYYENMGSLVIPVLAVLLLLSYTTRARFGNEFLTIWIIRAVVYIVIILINNHENTTEFATWLSPRPRHAMGELSAAECVLRAWRKPAPGVHLDPLILLFSGFVMAQTGNVTDINPIYHFSLPYACFLGLSLRSYRARYTPPGSRRAERRGHVIRYTALTAAVLIGLGTSYGLIAHQNDIADVASRLLGSEPPPPTQTVGMSTSPSLGQTFNASSTPVRVLRIQGYASDPHLRGMTFDTYNHGTWLPALRARDFTPWLPGARASTAGIGKTATVTCFIDEYGILFAPANVDTISGEDGAIVDAAVQSGGPVTTHDPPPYQYSMVQNKDMEHQGAFCIPRTDAYLKSCLAVPPEIAPGVHALAAEIGRGVNSPRARIEAVTTYLLTHHQYSKTTDPGRGDPVSNFLLQKKAAHCEFFASAAVMLLRCLNVPARYVTGFMANEREPGDVIVVRQWDAHAWAEAWVDGVGWVTVDGCPPIGRPDKAPKTAPEQQKLSEFAQDLIAPLKRWFGRLSTLQQSGLLILLILVYVGMQIPGWRRRMANVPPEGFTYANGAAEIEAITTRFNGLLANRGIPCPEYRPWREHFARLSVEFPTDSAAQAGKALINDPRANRFIELHALARFGPTMSKESVDEMSVLLDEWEAEKTNVPAAA